MNETYLFDDWGSSQRHEVDQWVKELEEGVGDNDKPCEYDLYNLRESGTFLIETLDQHLWTLVEQNLA